MPLLQLIGSPLIMTLDERWPSKAPMCNAASTLDACFSLHFTKMAVPIEFAEGSLTWINRADPVR
jgi:hypothetical protein